MDMNKYIKYPVAALGSMLALTGVNKAVSSIDDYVSANPQAQVWQASADYLSEIRQGLDGVAEAASDWQLRQYLTQPVEETLEGVDHVRVNDNNYKDEVFGSDTPVMVLFYCNRGDYSKGLAGLAAEIEERFGDDIKFCAFQLEDDDEIMGNDFLKYKAKYPIEDVPALICYGYQSNQIYNMGKDWHLQGGIETLGFLKEKIDAYLKYMPVEMIK